MIGLVIVVSIIACTVLLLILAVRPKKSKPKKPVHKKKRKSHAPVNQEKKPFIQITVNRK